jgi:predicted Zn-dependent protease
MFWPTLSVPEARITLRAVSERQETLLVRRGRVQPIETLLDAGVMVTVWLRHGMGYCATACREPAAIQSAAERALEWARRSEAGGLFSSIDLHNIPGLPGRPEPGPPSGRQATVGRPLPPRSALIDLLRRESEAMHVHPDIVNWQARLSITRSEQQLWVDGQAVHEHEAQFVEPNLELTAMRAGVVQTRTLGGQYNGFCQQGGFEVIEASGLQGGGERLAREVLQLVAAPVCPTGLMDLLLAPDQMMLQIHESIGHPLELDRILGDERNFAGGSFVTPDMFGRHVYGSPLLNVSFDPGPGNELASYERDDEGEIAQRVELIREGLLLRPLGSALSRARAQADGTSLDGTANARAIGWHRPPIDRMANLNLEPGDSCFEDLVAGIERGVYMRTNASWSIDDARNKFQFGCEWGQLIEDGRLTQIVRNPGYRGVSADFWRSLDGVGDATTVQVLGTPYCGKGEPGQVIRVGHASPACRFRGVQVFGNEA